ncbi:MAG TPA: molecular chaperone TorD family protein [Azospirillum sp.]
MNRERADAYLFLATLFASRPEPEAVAGMLSAAAGAPDDGGVTGELLAALRHEEDADALALRLAAEHTRLFRGVREGYGPPPPYESLWREGQMMGDCTVAVATAFLDAGYAYDGAWGPCDHIAEELRFMAALCTAGDADGVLERQAVFVERHLAAWLPAYCRTVAEQAREPLYRALASVTAQVVAQDGAHIRDLLGRRPGGAVGTHGA